MTARLIVCTTCDRSAEPRPEPSRGEALARAVETRARERGVDLAIVRVDCLDGCSRPCNAALRARGKPFRRFSGLSPADSDALIDVALAYRAAPSGKVAADAILAGHAGERAEVSDH